MAEILFKLCLYPHRSGAPKRKGFQTLHTSGAKGIKHSYTHKNVDNRNLKNNVVRKIEQV